MTKREALPFIAVITWLLLVAALAGTSLWAIQNGHPTATWFYCDTLHLCPWETP